MRSRITLALLFAPLLLFMATYAPLPFSGGGTDQDRKPRTTPRDIALPTSEQSESDGSAAPLSAPLVRAVGTFLVTSLSQLSDLSEKSSGSSPSGKTAGAYRIVFERREPRGDTDIYSMWSDGSGITRLTEDIWNDQGPVWSPDASRIAWHSARSETTNIFVMNADGSDETQITQDPSGALFPMWSSKDRIAFITSRDGNQEIYAIDPDGKNEVNLTKDPAADGFHVWSPNGKRLLFNSNRGSCLRTDGTTRAACPDLYHMKTDGSDLIRLTSDFRFELAPSWSPDGTRVAFVVDRDNSHKELFSAGALGDIYVVQLNPSGTPGALTRITTTMDANFPSWSPDGSEIVFTRDPSRLGLLSDLYIMKADGTNIRRLTDWPLDDVRPWAAPL